MSRTDDMRGRGAERQGTGGGGGGAPFVSWGDRYGWIEGEVTGTFDTRYGLAATIKVSGVFENGLDTQGSDEDGNRYEGRVTVGNEVNVGMGLSTLEGKITEDDVGKSFHVASDGWSESKSGQRFRAFTVIELTERDDVTAGGDDQPDSVVDDQADGYEDEIPF